MMRRKRVAPSGPMRPTITYTGVYEK